MYREMRAEGGLRQVDTAQTFAEFGCELRYEALPADVVEIAKKLVLDQLGVLVLGSGLAGIAELRRAANAWAGKAEATVLVHGDRIPADRAALINGVMARAMDYDAVHEQAIVHLTAGSFPQCLAIAERNRGVSGKDFITAMAAGMEFMVRLGLCTESVFLHTGRVTTLHQATFGGALAASKLLRFDAQQMVAALGIAFAHVSGTLQMAREGSVLVRVQQGFADQASIIAAVLAEQGLGSIQHVFQGEFGYFRAYHENKYDPAVLTRRLGLDYELLNTSVKYYPCCFLAHFSIDAMRQLVAEHKFTSADVERIDIRVTEGAYRTVCAPIEAKRAAASTEEALFSAPYTVATALLHGSVGLEHMLERSALDNPAVRALTAKIFIATDAELERQHGRVIGPSIVEVTLKGGRKVSRRVDFCKGHPSNPMSMDECEEKFWSCVPYAARPLDADKLRMLVQKVRGLENVGDVAELVPLLVA